ncbi:MAG TPA: type II secretion system protein [Candidatus Saccharimonas sp.]|nr:type II secretion system protein [Candidatus Saccharimonas sp.]
MRTSGGAAGFTLIEVLVVMAILAIVIGVAMVNLVRPQTQGDLVGVTQTLVADLKDQQAKAMAGDAGTGSTAAAQGVRVASGGYTLFRGSSYDGGDPDNAVVSPVSSISLSSTFSGGEVVFEAGSGEISGWSSGTDTITITNTVSSDSKTLTINRYGAITVN